MKRDIDIINECWNDIDKFNKIISFNSASVTMKSSLVLHKYYLWYLKHKLKVNVENGYERELFEKEIDECESAEERIELSYCLGELYLEDNMDEALAHFKYVSEKYNDNYYVDKNLVHMARCILEGKEKQTIEQDIISYEIKFLRFNSFDKDILNEEYIEDALWLSNKCANYKNTMELVRNYLKKHNSYENLSLALLNAYKSTKDISYIDELIEAIAEIEVIDFELSERILESLHFIKDIEIWSKLLIVFYEKTDKNDIEKILINIDTRLEHTSLYTNEYIGETSVIDLLIMIYEDIIKFKSGLDLVEKYEKNISKYLIYASYQNKYIPELYESYSKLKAIKDVQSDDIGDEELSILECIKSIEIPNEEELEIINEYPFEVIINNLRYILDGTKIFEKIQNRISDSIGNESIEDTLNSIIELINLSKDELTNNQDTKKAVFNNRIQKIDNIIKMIQGLKEENSNMLEKYFKYIEKSIDNFKQNINMFIVESIARIYSESLEFIRDFNNAETIYEEIKFKLKNDINEWGRGAYNNFLKENIYILLEEISTYILNQNNIINNQVVNLKKQCEGIYEFEEEFLYEKLELEELMKTLSNNSWILLQYIYINIDEMIRKNNSFDMGIQKPRLSLGTGLSKLFSQDDELLSKHKEHINESIQDAAKQTIGFIQQNIENIDLLLEAIICIVFENTYAIDENTQKQIINKGATVTAVSNNIQSIKNYCSEIEVIENNINDIKSYIIERNSESIKVTEEKFIDIEKLNVEIAKYEDQINNGVLYSDRQLFRI